VPRIEGKRLFNRLELLLLQAQSIQAGGEIRPQRRVAGVHLSGALKQLARLGGFIPLHHAHTQFIEHGRVRRRELRGAGQELVGLAISAGGLGSFARLDHPQDRAIVRRDGIDVAQESPLWCPIFARILARFDIGGRRRE
jgi:hypothetical protein